MFRTEIHLKPSPIKINLSDRIALFGSCFSIHMGEKLKSFKFNTLTNPFGTIYNPISLFQLIDLSLTGKEPESWAYLVNQGVYRNYYFHSDISSVDEADLQNQIGKTLNATKNFLLHADVLLLTFGSAIVYKLKENSKIVANCHKMPAARFSKSLLATGNITTAFNETYSLLKKHNPAIRVILTVSPVRHLKETLVQNSVSKATLRVACEEIVKEFEDVKYFPSYEFMMDDLRDYRFYKEDMLHPTEQTINYIWDKFTNCYFDEETFKFIKEWEKVLKAIHHRPFYPGSTEHNSFIKKTIEKLESYRNSIDTTAEIAALKRQLK